LLKALYLLEEIGNRFFRLVLPVTRFLRGLEATADFHQAVSHRSDVTNLGGHVDRRGLPPKSHPEAGARRITLLAPSRCLPPKGFEKWPGRRRPSRCCRRRESA